MDTSGVVGMSVWSLLMGVNDSIRIRDKSLQRIQFDARNGIEVRSHVMFALGKSESVLQVFSCIS